MRDLYKSRKFRLYNKQATIGMKANCLFLITMSRLIYSYVFALNISSCIYIIF